MSTTIDPGGLNQTGPVGPNNPGGVSSPQTGQEGMDLVLQFLNGLNSGSGPSATAQTNSTGITSNSTLSDVPDLDTTVSIGNQAATTPPASSPSLRDLPPDPSKDPFSNPQVGKALSGNPWLQRNALADIINVMMEVMATERRGAFMEAMKALQNNQALWQMTAEKVKLLNQQGELMLAKAISEFVVTIATAAVSAAVAAKTATSDNRAEAKIQKEVNEMKYNPKTGEHPEGGVQKWMENKQSIANDKEKLKTMTPGKEKLELEQSINKRELDLKERQPGFSQIEDFQKQHGLSVEGSQLKQTQQVQEKDDKIVLQKEDQQNAEKFRKENPKITDKDLEDLNTLKTTQQDRHTKLAPNGYLDTKNPDVQARIDGEMRLDATKYAAINDVNSKIGQAINQLLEGAFGLAQKKLEADMASVDQWLNALRMALDAASQNRASIQQDLTTHANSMRDLIGSWWQGVGSMR